MLTLPEELLLLSLDDHGHSHDVALANLDTGLLAAAIYELELRGRLEIEAEGITVKDASPTGDPELDEALKLIDKHAGKSLEDLLTAVHGHLGQIRTQVKEGLVQRGELREEGSKLFWLLPQKRYSVEHGVEEMSLLERLTRTLLLHEPPDRRTSALLTLAASCYASDNYLKERLFGDLRDRMYEVVNSGGEVQAVMRDSVCAALANTLTPFVP